MEGDEDVWRRMEGEGGEVMGEKSKIEKKN